MLLAGGTSALAAEGSAKSWLGIYAGITVNSDKFTGHDLYWRAYSERGISGATLFLGTNFFESHGVVVGAESEFKIGGNSVNDGEALDRLKQNYASTTKLRAGYAIGNLLPYATVGVSVGDFDWNHYGQRPTDSFRRIGFVWGGGLDWAVTPKFVVRAEFQRTQFGTRDEESEVAGHSHPIKIEVDEFRLGGAYKF